MILVMVGTNPYSFDRLVKAMDELALRKGWDVFIQLGNTSYIPQNCKWENFIERNRLLDIIRNADIVVTQGGVGGIRDALLEGKKVVAVPRKPELNESQDPQKELVHALEDNGRILAVYDIDNLEDVIEKAYDFIPKTGIPHTIPKIISEFLFNEQIV